MKRPDRPSPKRQNTRSHPKRCRDCKRPFSEPHAWGCRAPGPKGLRNVEAKPLATGQVA